MNEKLSRAWLRVDSILIILFGLAASFASYTETSWPWLALFDLLRWPLDGNPGSFDQTTKAVNAVLGGVMIGWGVSIFLLVGKDFLSLSKTIRKLLLIAVMCWFISDSTGSIFAEMPGNVVLNVLFVSILLPPLVFVKTGRQESET